MFAPYIVLGKGQIWSKDQWTPYDKDALASLRVPAIQLFRKSVLALADTDLGSWSKTLAVFPPGSAAGKSVDRFLLRYKPKR
jgi:hypothetical protein